MEERTEDKAYLEIYFIFFSGSDIKQVFILSFPVLLIIYALLGEKKAWTFKNIPALIPSAWLLLFLHSAETWYKTEWGQGMEI